MPEKPAKPSAKDTLIFFAKLAGMLIALGLFGYAMYLARRLRGA